MNKRERAGTYPGSTPEEIQEALSTMEVAPEGVSQDLADAAHTITALATFYGRYNGAKGFNKAIKQPGARAKIQEHMTNSVDHVGAAMHRGTATGYVRNEAALFAPLVRAEALAEAGYDPRDIEEAGQLCLISLRRKIGVGVSADTRASYVRSLQKTAGARLEK